MLWCVFRKNTCCPNMLITNQMPRVSQSYRDPGEFLQVLKSKIFTVNLISLKIYSVWFCVVILCNYYFRALTVLNYVFPTQSEQLRNYISDIFGAGIPNLVVSLLWMILCALHNPESHKLVVEEIDRVLGEPNNCYNL